MTATTAKRGIIAFVTGSALVLGSCAKENGYDQATGYSSADALSEDVHVSHDKTARAMYVPGEAVVVFSEEMTARIEKAGTEGGDVSCADEFDAIRKELGISRMERLFPYAGEFEERTRAKGLHRFYLVDFDAAVNLDTAEAAFESLGGVELFERQHMVTDLTVNDPYFSKLWGLSSTASAKTNINVEPVWEYTMGDPAVIVNVVDTGVDLYHEDLSWNCSTKDNYNFVTNSAAITAGDHGTHVAGTIAAVGNNGKGVVGIAGGDYAAGKRGVTILSSQVFSDNGSARSFANAIKWGADHGAVISQNSWGYSFDYDDNGKLEGKELQDALNAQADYSIKEAVNYFIEYAGCDKDGNQAAGSPMKGGLVVFSAGNDGIRNGAPANYEPIFSVGAVRKAGYLDSYSNYGEWVDICAPGTDILSTFPNDKYASISGTSMACPHVSGAAALLLSFFQREGLTCDDLIDMLRNGADPNKINYSGKPCGPYLDVNGSFQRGIELFARKFNNDPVIEQEYEGELVFRHWEDVTVPFHIYDPDGDRLNVTADFSGRGNLAKDETRKDIYNLSVLCQLISDTAPQKFTISAKDFYGAVTKKEFSYTVLPNRAPESTKTLGNLLFKTADKGTDIDISGLFTDPDEETLRTSVKATPSGIIKAELENDRISIKISGAGLAKVSVSATDHMGEKASTEFMVLVRPRDNEIEYYPNPVKDILHIRTGLEKDTAKITISSSIGKPLLEKSMECSAFEPAEIDMKDFAPGQYMLTVTSGGKTISNVIAKI